MPERNPLLTQNDILQLQYFEEAFSPTKSLESFTENLLHIFKDFVLRLTRNIKTNISEYGASFKRSELKAYYDGNSSKLDHLLKTMGQIPNIPIPIPDGMLQTYLPTFNHVTALESLFSFSEMLPKLIERLKSSLEQQGDFTKQAATFRQFRDYALDQRNESFLDQQKQLFTTGHSYPVDATKQFTSPVDVKTCLQLGLKFNTVFKTFCSLDTKQKELCSAADHLVDRCVQSPDDFDIKGLVTMIRTTAQYLDFYGVLLHDMQRLEHNFTLTLKTFLSYQK